MSALTDRITEVLREHWLHHDNRCRCDKSRKVLTGAEWQAHVAERIAAAITNPTDHINCICPKCVHEEKP